MTLPEYIRSIGGPENFAEKHSVTVRSATAYMYGQRRPASKTAIRLSKETPVSLESMLTQ